MRTMTKNSPIPTSKLRAARESAGLTLVALAVKAGLSPTTVYHSELAPQLASKRTLDAVSKVLGVPVEDLR